MIAVAHQKSTLRELARIAESSLAPETIARLTVCSPEDLLAHLDREDTEVAAPATVRGYKVRLNYRSPSNADSRSRAEAVSRVLARGARRVR